MGHNRGKRLRLELFEAGNTRCPLCLTEFTEAEVEAGSVVTLEHAPPRSLGGRPVCLTCKKCNLSAGHKVDQAAVALERERKTGARAEFSIEGETAYGRILEEQGGLVVRITSYSAPAFNKRRSGTAINMTVTTWNPRYAAISRLKSAYLLLVSLLGRHGGYRCAEGAAMVRKQIMKPKAKIIERFALRIKGPSLRAPDGVYLNRKGTPCWAVKIADCMVLLPRGGDESFYTDAEIFRGDRVDIGDGPMWAPVRFGETPTGIATYREESDAHKAIGEINLFGAKGRWSIEGRDHPFVIADHQGRYIVMLSTNFG